MTKNELHRQQINTYMAEGRTVSGGNIDDFSDDGSGSFDTSGLIESLASSAAGAYETTQALNANPLNTALLYGGTASTRQGTVGSAPTVGAPASQSLLLLLLAGGVIAYVALR